MENNEQPKKWDGEGFDSLSILNFSFKESAKSQAHIYANGSNQVEVVVKIRILDKENTPLKIKPEEINDLIYFVNYTDGTEIKELEFANEPSEYVKPLLYRSHASKRETGEESSLPPEELNSSIIFVSKYISSSVSSIEKQIAVGIDIPGVGKFDTSLDGTDTKNGPEGDAEPRNFFKSPRSLIIKTESPVDYSQKEAWNIEYNPVNISEFTKKAENIKVYSSKEGSINFAEVGISSFKEVKIKPKNGFKLKRKIRERNFSRQDIADSVNSVAIAGYTVETGENNNKQIRPNDTGSCEILWGYQEEGKGFHVSFLFIDKNRSGIAYTSPSENLNYNRGIKLTNTSGEDYTYTIEKGDERHIFNSTLSSDYINILIADHFVPNIQVKQKSFHSLPENGTSCVTVTDEYGNIGKVKIVMNNFTWPGISINT